MRFTLKAQSIGSEESQNIEYISTNHEFKVENDELRQKRGVLFITLNLSANRDFDLTSAVKLFIDTIQEDFYRINDDTPLHGIEKSLNKAYKDLVSFKSKDGNSQLESENSEFRFSFATALVWNSVLYTSYFNFPAIYLIRGSGVRNLGPSPEDISHKEIWTNSAILAENDVVIIGNEEFSKMFNHTEIASNLGNLSRSINSSEQKNKISALLIKVSSESSNKSEKVGDKFAGLFTTHTISNALWRLRSKVADSEALSDKFQFYQSKKTAPISSISGLIQSTPAKGDISTKIRPKRLSAKINGHGRKKKTLIAGLIMLFGLGYINYLVLSPKSKVSESDISPQIADVSNPEVQGTSTSPDQELHERFANLNDYQGGISPIAIDATQKDLVILDKSNLYKINLADKAFSTVYKGIEFPEKLRCDKARCYVYGNKTLFVIDPETPEKVDKYLLDLSGGVIDIHPYSNSVYILTSENIYKLTLMADTPTTWLAEGQTLGNPTSLAASSNLFLLENRNLSEYSGGKQNSSFSVDNSYLLGPVSVTAYNDKLFVLDALADNEKSIVKYDEFSGKLAEKVVLSPKEDTDSISMFGVIKDAKGSIIYKKGNYLYKTK